MTDKIINIESLIINRRREKECKCKKPFFEIDTTNHLVHCRKCMVVIEPFEALLRLATYIEDINYEIERAKEYKQELMNYKPWLREAKRYEHMMRQKDMLPTCPSCNKPFKWNQINGMINKRFYKEKLE